MADKYSDDFKRDAVRIAISSGLTRQQVASDLGIGRSTLNSWVKLFNDTPAMCNLDPDLVAENVRLRQEVRILKEERDVLKKATQFFAGQRK